MTPKKILISRTDNIGDVILTLPLVYLLKQRFTGCEIVFLGREYVRAIVGAYPLVDSFLCWDTLDKMPEAEAAAQLTAQHIDTVLHVFPRPKIARLAAKAKIALRVGIARRWYHYIYCNKRVSRAVVAEHEAQRNLQLLAPFDINTQMTLEALRPLVKLTPTAKPVPQKIADLVDPTRFNLIVHPLSNGHAKEWPMEFFQGLIHTLPESQFNIFISGSKPEIETLKPLIAACPTAHAICGELSLEEFLSFIAQCDGLLASSTGPLHMAAALGVKALGLYPPPQGINPTRWAPLGAQAKYLVHNAPNCATQCQNPDGRTCACLRALSVEKVRALWMEWAKPS